MVVANLLGNRFLSVLKLKLYHNTLTLVEKGQSSNVSTQHKQDQETRKLSFPIKYLKHSRNSKSISDNSNTTFLGSSKREDDKNFKSKNNIFHLRDRLPSYYEGGYIKKYTRAPAQKS